MNFIGIDLGTTNSVIYSFDGKELKLYKSPSDQNDVTPSAIFLDRRGNRLIGRRAYDAAPYSPENAAILFKRFMGTSTPIRLAAANLTLSAEECSAEVLKLLFGYLPEEIRNSQDSGTVVTVPAAFNQMQKDATLAAAEIARLGNVALMQEPVAAVMSVMHNRKVDGVFLIFDMGGGTLDVALAQSISGRVSLLAHGGIEMCGGRDFDRILFDNVVKPWLLDHFDLPDAFEADPQFRNLRHVALWATEKAKIELSAKEEAVVALDESQVRVKDRSGSEVYFDVEISRAEFDGLIEEKISDAIEATRVALSKAGLSAHDVERMVFIGGPTNYKPLRDKVSFELGIPNDTQVNPMTAVAEGAALFAESIDWSSERRGRKTSRGSISAGGGLNLSFNYIARTPDVRSKVAVQITGNVLPGTEFQIDSLDSGWTSGRISLRNGATLDLTVPKNGENTFKVFVFDPSGGPIQLGEDRIIITRTAATIDAIPASHSIGIEVLEKVGGQRSMDFLVKAGDPLPVKGSKKYKAVESLRSGCTGALIFNLREGEIESPVEDNQLIGTLKIEGNDFSEGVIAAGADLECEFEISDSGIVTIEVSVPSITGSFRSHNFYSRQEGQIDYTVAAKRIKDEGTNVSERLEEVAANVSDPKLERARKKVEGATHLEMSTTDPETCKQAMDDVLEAKRLLADVRKQHRKVIWQMDLDRVVGLFNDQLRQHAKPSEASAFDNLTRTAQRAIEKEDPAFEGYLDQLKNKNWEVVFRQDWFVIDRFNRFSNSPHLFPDQVRFKELVAQGRDAIEKDEIDRLRTILSYMYHVSVSFGPNEDIVESANILKG